MEVTLSYAKELMANYATNHWATINAHCPSISAGQVDSRCVWFGLTYLQPFLSAVAPQFFPSVDPTPTPGPGQCDGIRIYFGEYSQDMVTACVAALQAKLTGNEATDAPIQAEIATVSQYSGLHTLLIVPTIPGPNGTHVDYDFNSGNSDFALVPVTNTISAMNHGQLIPPPFPAHGTPTNPGYDDMALGATLMCYVDTGA